MAIKFRPEVARSNWGQSIGVLMLDTSIQRIPGDIGNQSTFSYPVTYKVVKYANAKRVTVDRDPLLIQHFIKAGRELQEQGCKALTTSCGFMACFQKGISEGVDIPFFSSSLMQAKFISDLIGVNKKVGILTYNAKLLGEAHFKGCGIEDIPKLIYGMDGTWFDSAMREGRIVLEEETVRRDVVAVTKRMVKENPDVGAILIECTNLPPYSYDIQEALGLPVFDIVTLMNYVHSTLVRSPFQGFM